MNKISLHCISDNHTVSFAADPLQFIAMSDVLEDACRKEGMDGARLFHACHRLLTSMMLTEQTATTAAVVQMVCWLSLHSGHHEAILSGELADFGIRLLPDRVDFLTTRLAEGETDVQG